MAITQHQVPRNAIACVQCDEKPHVGAYQCPACSLAPLCITHYDEHVKQCAGRDKGDLTVLLKRLSQCVDAGTQQRPDYETTHLMADNALLDYIGDERVRDLFRRINKRYA